MIITCDDILKSLITDSLTETVTTRINSLNHLSTHILSLFEEVISGDEQKQLDELATKIQRIGEDYMYIINTILCRSQITMIRSSL